MELATRPFMEEMRDLAKITSNEKLKNKVLELIQVWAHAFRNDSSCRSVGDVMNLMKAEGFKFPVLKESDAMFAAETAPQWAEGDSCHRCRVSFGIVNRKHHCRCCGQIFCDKCSARMSAIPKYGIEKEVRVCDECYDKLNKTIPLTLSKPVAADTSNGSQSGATKASAPAGKSEQELREEEELQLAIALSKSEAENRDKTPRRTTAVSSAPVTKGVRENGNSSDRTTSSSADSVAERERQRYLNREYWEQKSQEQSRDTNRRSSSPAPSAPSSAAATVQPAVSNVMDTETVSLVTAPQSNDRLAELTAFTSNLQRTLEIFKNRMEANKFRGRPISNDSAVQSLFLNVTNMHSQLLQSMHEEEEKRIRLEELQDKLSDIGAARGALDLLRDEHRERKRREAEAQDALRQQQMAQKLDIMRKQKQEYLQYQRQIALQRLQDQEREMQIRKEQQKYPLPQQIPPQPQSVPQVQWSQPSGVPAPPPAATAVAPVPPAIPPPGYYAPSQPMSVHQMPSHMHSQPPPPHQHASVNQYIPPAYGMTAVYPNGGGYAMPPPHMSPMHAPVQQPQMGHQIPVYQQHAPQSVAQPPPAPEPEEPLITFD